MPNANAAAASNEVFSTLAQFEFFKSFSPSLLEQLAQVAVYRVVGKGDNLLTQGQLNSNLYILITGSLGVLVDGVRVANLDAPGDLVGEMSVISLRPCSAKWPESERRNWPESRMPPLRIRQREQAEQIELVPHLP